MNATTTRPKLPADADFRLGELLGAAGHRALAVVFLKRAAKGYGKAVKAKRGGR